MSLKSKDNLKKQTENRQWIKFCEEQFVKEHIHTEEEQNPLIMDMDDEDYPFE